MSEKWTEEQKEAIYTETGNILVAAGAGAGKTAVLVNRIIRKIMDEKSCTDIDRLLVVTYTNAAASEMKERIGDKIQRNLEENFESSRLQRQLALLNQANIMTMHSFCLKVIRENFQLIDLDPGFRVADSDECILLKQEAVSELFEEKYDEEDHNFLKFVDSFGYKDDSRAMDIVVALYEFVQSVPWPHEWLQNAERNFCVGSGFDFSISPWAEILIQNIKKEIGGMILKLENSAEKLRTDDCLKPYLEVFVYYIDELKKCMELTSWNKIKKHIDEFTFKKLPTIKGKDYNVFIKESSKKAKNSVKKSLDGIKDKISTAENIGKSISDMHPIIKCLTDMTIEFEEKYSSKKRERDIIDFNDIEHFCMKILVDKYEDGQITPSNAALYYRKFFEEILIDEYQDSNSVQEVIINMICRKDDMSNLFMVGDVKQSIYRFRQAKPELFLEKYKSYSQKKGSINRRIKLFKNFRSRFNIIDAVNYIFGQIMCTEVGELDYDREEELQGMAQYPESELSTFENESVELHIIDRSNESEGEENFDGVQAEARLVAKKIEELVQSGVCVYDKTKACYRGIAYSDIVVLMRSTKGLSPVFVEQFNNCGIPVFADVSTGYFDTIEIKTIMSVLGIIDNPIQDIPLIAVLRSPIENFSPEELIDIRISNKDMPFYKAMRECVKSDETSDELKCKITKFMNRLHIWRKKVLYMSIDEFLWYIYMDTGYYGFAGAMPGGIQRQANLRMLFQKAEQYEKTSYKGLFNFINFINKLRMSSGDMGSAKVLGENENVVRIMSIHKSKGLEFPVVILAGAGKNFNTMDMKEPVMFDEKLGIASDYVDCVRRVKYTTVVKEIFKNKLKNETLSEEMRILYVAFTRAKEKLIITGSVANLEKSVEKWCEESINGEKIVPSYSLLKARNYMDWICEALVRHKDGNVIRDASAGSYTKFHDVKGVSKWNIKLWNKNKIADIPKENKKSDIVDEIKSLEIECGKSSYFDEINRRLDWKYKYYDASIIPAKFSVSELKKRFIDDSNEYNANFDENKGLEIRIPDFMRDKKEISPAYRGTLMHLVMQHINISDTEKIENIILQIESLANREFMRKEDIKFISPSKIFQFFKSDLGMRIKKSLNVRREVPFYMEVESGEIYDNLPDYISKNEKVLLQGIIDCYFEEEDGLVLVDYKTDYVENIDDIKNKYKIQIKYYSKALESITGKIVKEKYLYLFSIGKPVLMGKVKQSGKSL